MTEGFGNTGESLLKLKDEFVVTSVFKHAVRRLVYIPAFVCNLNVCTRGQCGTFPIRTKNEK